MMTRMPVRVRPARSDDTAAVDLLYESAAPYYDAYAGNAHRARRMLAAVFPRSAHTTSWEVCRVAELEGDVVGVMAAFPAPEGDRLARRFLALSVPHLPVWRWPGLFRHLRAAAGVAPLPPVDSLYVDALAVAPPLRRRGIAHTLLDEAAAMAAAQGLGGVALDTGLDNSAAQALYEACGFEPGEVRRAPSERAVRAVGGPGFVSYFKAL